MSDEPKTQKVSLYMFHVDEKVVLEFSEAVKWFGMSAEEARNLATSLTEFADLVEAGSLS